MGNKEATAYFDDYADRADKWLEKLKSSIVDIENNSENWGQILIKDLKDLHEVLERANFVCKAATGEQAAIDHIVFNKVDGLNIGMNHWAANLLATSLAGSVEEAGGINYVMLEFNGHPKGPLLVTIQFKDKKNPGVIAAERQAYIEDLELVLKDKNQEIEDLKTEIEGLEIAIEKGIE